MIKKMQNFMTLKLKNTNFINIKSLLSITDIELIK